MAFKKLSDNLGESMQNMESMLVKSRLNIRTENVRRFYKEVIEKLYGEAAPLILEHTNNVYILKEDTGRRLIVYVDESIFAAELNARRELIKLKMLELFKEPIEEFDILISRGKYKENHPYKAVKETKEQLGKLGNNSITELQNLSDREQSYVNYTVSSIEDLGLKASFEKAMTANLQWNKTEKLKNSKKE